MLTIEIVGKELYDENIQEFRYSNSCVLCLEHSLVSISKWEAKWHKSFLNTKEKSNEELIDYIRCMTTTQKVDDDVFYSLSVDNMKRINEYIGDARTATTFAEKKTEGSSSKEEIVTSELIYYWMVAYQIPFECQKWHLNRLLTLIKICSIKNNNTKDNRMSKRSVYASNKALNMARRKQSGSKG